MLDDVIRAIDRAAGYPDFGDASDRELVELTALWHQVEAAVCARKLESAAELLLRRQHQSKTDDPLLSRADPFNIAESEVSAALTVTSNSASDFLHLGQSLQERLPNVLDAFARGQLDLARVRIIERATAAVAPELIKLIEDRILKSVLDGPAPLTGQRLRAAIDRVIVDIDKDGLRARRERTHAERRVTITPAADGGARLGGSLPADGAATLNGRLNEMAKRLCSADPRSFAARRADAIVALAAGLTDLECRCGEQSCPSKSGAFGVARKPLMHVIARQDTLDGGDQPGWITGFGFVDAEYVRQLSRVATIRGLDLSSGANLGKALRYRLSQRLRDQVSAIFGSCQFPNCDEPAWQCDLDHREPFDAKNPSAGGQSNSANSGPFCRKHHNGKTLRLWRIRRSADGALTMISPAGLTYPIATTGPVELLGGRTPPRADPSTGPPAKRGMRAEQRRDRLRSERAGNRRTRILAVDALVRGLSDLVEKSADGHADPHAP